MMSKKEETRPLIHESVDFRTRAYSYDTGHADTSYGAMSRNVFEVTTSKQKNKNAYSPNTGSESDISEKSSSHCHESVVRKHNSNAKARKTLIIASILCLCFMILEVLGGYLAGSLAIMTDAAHLLSDFASFMISLISLFLASRPATRRMSFGWHRAEVIGAVVSVLMIWVLTGILVYVALERIINKNYDIQGGIMLITSGVGVAVNIIMGYVLHRGGHTHSHGGGSHSHGESSSPHSNRSNHADVDHVTNDSGIWIDTGRSDKRPLADCVIFEAAEEADERRHKWFKLQLKSGHKRKSNDHVNINVRAALIHVVGDFIQSFFIFIAALIIYFRPDLAIMDPICTFVFSILVLLTTLSVMRDALNVLMEGLPRGMNFTEVAVALQSLDGVKQVHDLRIWSLTMDKVALSVHLAVNEEYDTQEILRQATQLLRERYQVYECTVQIEHYSNAMDECKGCENPQQ